MKITIVTGAFFPVPPILGGAVEKVWFALGQEFVRRGHEVTHISRAHPELPTEETIAGVKHRRVSGFAQPRSIVRLKLLDLIYSLGVWRILPRADILVTNTFWLPLLVRGTKHGLIYVHVQRGPKGQMKWYAHVARLCAVSRAIADEIVAQAPGLRAKVAVLPNALPFRIESLPNEKRERALLFVGRVHPEKGLQLLLHALGLLPVELRAKWKIKIVGPHEIEFGGGGVAFLHEMQRLGEESGAKIEWCGRIFDAAELSRQYRSAPLFIYPSVAETGEALPVAPLEAMASGCAPIVSALACFRDYVKDDANGFVFDHRTPEPAQSLAARLAQILQLPEEELAPIGQAARATATEFSVENVAPRYLADFESLLKL
ncbi:MAG: glycosyltransferase family 4 protein [Chthoniobacterales bacterium]|nr:glycosyltransferase family 4 protein [Chthoniobacterales bacterium]